MACLAPKMVQTTLTSVADTIGLETKRYEFGDFLIIVTSKFEKHICHVTSSSKSREIVMKKNTRRNLIACKFIKCAALTNFGARMVTFVNEDSSFKVSNLDLVVRVKNDERRALSKVTRAFECFRQTFFDYNFDTL